VTFWTALTKYSGMFRGRSVYNYLLGNRNYGFDHTGNVLLEVLSDSSGQKFPLALSFKWSDGEFKLVDVAKEKRYKTSFDCDKADSDAEKMICVTPDLAESDVQLASPSKKLMNKRSGTGKASLREDQAKWLADRDAQ
jgi:hypothetical protein